MVFVLLPSHTFALLATVPPTEGGETVTLTESDTLAGQTPFFTLARKSMFCVMLG